MTRSDSIHTYPILAYLQCVRAGEICHARFGRGVGALHPRRHNPKTEVMLMMVPLRRADIPRDTARAEEDAIQVDADDLVPIGIKEFRNGRLPDIDPGVVHHDVDRAQIRLDGRDHAVDRQNIRNICGVSPGFTA